MTTPRAALEAFRSYIHRYFGSHIDGEPEDGRCIVCEGYRAALAEAPAEAERCAFEGCPLPENRTWHSSPPCRRRGGPSHDHEARMCHDFQPAPLAPAPAPTAEALRDALLAEHVAGGPMTEAYLHRATTEMIAAAMAEAVPDAVSLTEAYERGIAAARQPLTVEQVARALFAVFGWPTRPWQDTRPTRPFPEGIQNGDLDNPAWERAAASILAALEADRG